jgi:hypothetical protein
MCAVKLLGRPRDARMEGEATQTLLVRTGRGRSPDEARRAALAQLALVYGSPVEPPPVAIISQKPSDPPRADVPPAGGPSGWVARLRRALARLFGA